VTTLTHDDEIQSAPETLVAAALLGSLCAFGTSEVLRVVRLERAPLAHVPGVLDYGHVALGGLFMALSFGALVLAYRLVSRRLAGLLRGSLEWWLGSRLSDLTLRSWLEVGVPFFFIGWLLIKGTRGWTPNVTVWLLFVASLVGTVPVVWVVERATRFARERARGRRGVIAAVAIGLAIAGALGWWALTATFGMRYGKSHLVTYGLLVTWCSIVFGEAFTIARWRAPRRAGAVLWAGMLVVSMAAFVLPPSAGARALFYAERPTSWFGLSLARLGPDADGDGFARPVGFTAGQDCDDHDPLRNPRQPELVGNGIDDNCFGGDQTGSFRDLLAEPIPRPEQSAPVSNVLVLLLDSWRFEPLKPGGIDPGLTPAIATLARESLVFDDYRTCSPRTLESFGDLFFGRLMPTSRGASPVSAVERLTATGVHTVDISSRFRHEHDRVSGWWKELSIPGSYGKFGDSGSVQQTQRMLRGAVPEPFFVATHLMGAHEPYEPALPCSGEKKAYERYRCALRLLDTRVGEILQTLSERGLRDRTVIAVSADHGEEFGEHGARFHANTVYDEVLHVPFIVRVPGGRHERVGEPIGCFDFMPTLLGAAKHAPDALLIGHDYSRAPRPSDRPQFARTRPLDARGLFEPKRLSVVYRGVKLLVDRQSGTKEYFDLKADPEERRPLARVRPDTERELTQKMDAWLSELARQSIPDERTASVKR
jgi:hypothetical protein